jgi:hypothetical protein
MCYIENAEEEKGENTACSVVVVYVFLVNILLDEWSLDFALDNPLNPHHHNYHNDNEDAGAGLAV